MPANTSPDNLSYPVAGDLVAPLQGWFQDLAGDAQLGLDKLKDLSYANNAAFPTASTLTGRFARNLADNWFYWSDGTAWRKVFPVTAATIDGVTTQAQMIAAQRNALDIKVQSADPGHSEMRIWIDLP